MKICYLANGKKEAIFIQRWANYFAKKHDVSVISYHGAEGFDKSVKIYYIPISGKSKIGKSLGFLNFIIKSRKIIKKINPDIIHAHYLTNYGFAASLINHHPFIASVYGSDVFVNPKQSILMKFVVKRTLKKADILVPTAEFTEKYLVEKFDLPKDKIKRISWGTDLKIFHRGYKKEVKRLKKSMKIKKGSPIVISNRSMAPIYQIEKIIESIPYVVKKYPNAIFIFLRGSGSLEYEKKLKLLTKKLNVEKNTRFISRLILPKEMAIFLNASDISISMVKSDQFAHSIMESMICNTIPIVSNIEVYEQYLKDSVNAFFVNPNPKQISEKIIFSLENLKLKKQFYNINKKIIKENENWDKNIKNIEELYKILLN